MTRCDSPRIGEVLVEEGVLTRRQVAAVLAAQRRRARPFGVLAERLFGVDAAAVERAWAKQYAHRDGATADHDPRPQRAMLRRLTRRQAWQFRLIPLRVDGDGDLVCITTPAALPRALRFARARFGDRVLLKVATDETIESGLRRCYPWPAMLLGERPAVALRLADGGKGGA